MNRLKPLSAIAGVLVTIAGTLAMAAGPAQADGVCGSWTTFGGGYYTSLGSGWTSLAVRYGPCTASGATASPHGEGQRWYVARETHGQFICRGRYTYGYGTSKWSRTSTDHRWSWAGGTTNPSWDYHSGC